MGDGLPVETSIVLRIVGDLRPTTPYYLSSTIGCQCAQIKHFRSNVRCDQSQLAYVDLDDRTFGEYLLSLVYCSFESIEVVDLHLAECTSGSEGSSSR